MSDIDFSFPRTTRSLRRLQLLLDQMAADAPLVDAEGSFPEKTFRQMAAAGLLSITLPGDPLDFRLAPTRRLLQLLKRIGGASLSVGRVYEGHINALYLIHLFGTTGQQEAWYAHARNGCLFSVWNTQERDGVRIRSIGPGRYVLEGSKTFCSGGHWIDRPLVTAEWADDDRRGWQMTIVPTGHVRPIGEDRRFWQPMGMKASASFRMDFTGVELSDADLLGNPDDYYRQPYFGGGAIRFAAVQLGGAEALVDATRAFLDNLHRTDDPFQKVRMAEMACLIESGNQWITSAANKADRWLKVPADPNKTVAYANMTRTAIADVCERVIRLTEQSVGARGLMQTLPFERIIRDLSIYLRQPAPDAALLHIGEYVFNQNQLSHDRWR